MKFLYLIFQFTILFSNIVTIYYAYRLSKHPQSLKKTWGFIMWGIILMMILRLDGLFYLNLITDIQSQFPPLIVFIGGFVEMTSRLLIMYGVVKTYDKRTAKYQTIDQLK